MIWETRNLIKLHGWEWTKNIDRVKTSMSKFMRIFWWLCLWSLQIVTSQWVVSLLAIPFLYWWKNVWFHAFYLMKFFRPILTSSYQIYRYIQLSHGVHSEWADELFFFGNIVVLFYVHWKRIMSSQETCYDLEFDIFGSLHWEQLSFLHSMATIMNAHKIFFCLFKKKTFFFGWYFKSI